MSEYEAIKAAKELSLRRLKEGKHLLPDAPMTEAGKESLLEYLDYQSLPDQSGRRPPWGDRAKEAATAIRRLEAENKSKAAVLNHKNKMLSLLGKSNYGLLELTNIAAKQAAVIEEIKNYMKQKADEGEQFSCCELRYTKILSIINAGVK